MIDFSVAQKCTTVKRREIATLKVKNMLQIFMAGNGGLYKKL